MISLPWNSLASNSYNVLKNSGRVILLRSWKSMKMSLYISGFLRYFSLFSG